MLFRSHARVAFDAEKKVVTIGFKEGVSEYAYTVQFSEAPTAAQVRDVNDAVFGAGQALELAGESGTLYTLTLYHGRPFVFMQTTLENAEPELTTHRHYSPFTISATMGAAVRQVKALGTGGLSGADKKSNSGSYAFLSIADPQTRNGIVAAWLTNERGSGVVFSDIQNDTLVVEPRIDYGRLQLDAGQTEALEIFIFGGFKIGRAHV